MSFLNLAEQVITLQHDCIHLWKQSGIQFTHQGILSLVEENHAFNYQLWHAEDRARRDDLGFEFVYRAKREIDQYNQQRNNRMEAIDDWLFEALKPPLPSTCTVHSETPGMMVDRLSILALKAYHMNQQALRTDANDTHRQACIEKTTIIQAQLIQLQACLAELINDVQKKTRTFRIYRQFKMYNDPALNPQLYKPACESA